MIRLRSDLWVNALIRRAQGAGAFATIAKRGAREAGAIYLIVNHLNGRFDCYGPAPQSLLMEESVGDRQFVAVLVNVPEPETAQYLSRERDFDPDLWIVEIEDRDGRPFTDIADQVER